MKSSEKIFYIAPSVKFVLSRGNSVLCNSQTTTNGVGLNDYDTYTGTDTGSDF